MSSKQNAMAVAGVLSGSLIWGLIWYPYRVLLDAGVAGPLATLLTYLVALICGLFMLPRVWLELRIQAGSPGIWWMVGLVISAGWANLGYVLGMLHGEVMRVLLLFYLSPLWTMLFSYWLLDERLGRYGYLIMLLSLGGAVTMLWQPQHGWPLPQNIAEWIGLSAGISFAFSNVASRRAVHLQVETKSYAVLVGTALLTGPFLVWQGGAMAQMQAVDLHSWEILGLLGVSLCCTSFAVQYGVTYLPASRAMLLFLSELVVAAVSSYWLAGEILRFQEWLGAALIVSASLLSGKLYSQLQTAE